MTPELRQRLAPTPLQAGINLAAGLLALWAASSLLRWALLDASWTIAAPTDCRRAAGACWPFLAERLGSLVYGFDPAAAFGGLALTLAVAGVAIVLGLPAGLLLALMRTSDLPLARWTAVAWIELWRGLPTVAVLFLAVTVFPLLTPPGVEPSKLLRVLAAFTLMTAALFAEAIRGGLESLPATQREAGLALGLGRWRTLRLVLLPQALAAALPNIVNVCVALVKETTLVVVIGLYDLFGIVQAAIVDPAWASPQVTATGYAAAAAGFWLVCFGLSRLSRRLEATSAAAAGTRACRAADRHRSPGSA